MSAELETLGFIAGKRIFISPYDPSKAQTAEAMALAANWLKPCGLKTNSYEQGMETRTDKVFPNCDPSAAGDAATTITSVVGLNPMTVSASGDVAKTMLPVWRDIVLAKKAHPFRIFTDDEGGFWEGNFTFGYSVSGEREGGAAQVSVNLTSSGDPVWVEA